MFNGKSVSKVITPVILTGMHPEALACTFNAIVSQTSLFQKQRKQVSGIWENSDTPLPELLQLMASRETF